MHFELKKHVSLFYIDKKICNFTKSKTLLKKKLKAFTMQKNLLIFPDWIKWLKENIDKQCNLEDLKAILKKNGFSQISVENVISGFNQLDFLDKATPNHYYCFLTKQDTNLNVFRVNTDKLAIFVIDEFLTDQECSELRKIDHNDLIQSPLTYDNGDTDFRTSSTSYLNPNKYPMIEMIDKKISEALGIPVEYGEPTQLQKYQIGQQFKTHKDAFDPGTDAYEKYAEHWGNRTWTFMVYLSDVLEGGETYFPEIHRKFKPTLGRAVIWNNLHDDGIVNKNSLHAGNPVIQGEKYVITKWYRQKPRVLTNIQKK